MLTFINTPTPPTHGPVQTPKMALSDTGEGSFELPRMHTALIFGALAAVGSGSAALAQSAGCADINGFSSPFVAVRGFQQISALPLSAGETVRISGSQVTRAGGGADGWYVSDPASGPSSFGSGALSAIFTATGVPFSETFVVPVGGMLSFGLSETGPLVLDMFNVSIMCSGGGSNLAVFSSVAQQQAITTSLGRNYRNRFGNAGAADQPSDGIFASTKGQSEDISAWVAMSGRTYWDGYDGDSVDLTFGADKFVSANTLLGVMLGVNRLSVSDATGASTDANAAMLGVYAAHSYSDGTLTDAYLAWSRVSYDASGSSFDTDRWSAGVAVTGSIEQAAGTLQPRARLAASWEDFSTGATGVVAGTSQQITASIGGRFDWKEAISGTALKPFASVDFEYGSIKDTAGVRDTFIAPRFGFGVNGMVGAGVLTASFDVGQTTSDVYDAGIDLNYEFSF